jgi:hypothetical protein
MSEDNKEQVIPKAYLNRPRSFKGSSLKALGVMLSLHNKGKGANKGLNLAFRDGIHPPENIPLKALFLTSAGVITGEFPYLPEEGEEVSERLTIRDTFSRVLDADVRHMEEEEAFTSLTSGTVIPLANVTIKTNTGDILNFNEFLLFSEDVIGCYFIPKDHKFE